MGSHPDQEQHRLTREEWDNLRADITEIKTDRKGNDMGTVGVISRLLNLEAWRDEARLKLALIAGGLGASVSALVEVAKHWSDKGNP